MFRSQSQTTLSTLIHPQQEAGQDDSDIVSLLSDSTLINPTLSIFNHPLQQYTTHNTIPIISKFLSPGVELYNSYGSFESNAAPILSTKFNLLKSNFLNIYKEKQLFCKVDFKIHSNYITYYVLTFQNEVVYLIMNNSNYPTIDFAFCGSFFRIMGITGTTSSLGSANLIKLFIMRSEKGLLCDGIEIERGKRLKIDNELSNLIQNDMSKVKGYIHSSTPLIGVPLATFVDSGDVKVNKNGGRYVKHGYIQLFDYLNEETVSEHMLMICCILLTLREQEYRKFKGDKKSNYVG
ncbi:unnamed protein product [Candida verbasci]|uniref:Uncharacterized protein n=1 Tax=Candida verbasci TaxID=1227364 RepID=A0A9W4U0X7_9ASCO|nr:unnamed protein product [Candida verbasci]